MKKVTLAILAVATLASTAVSAHQAGDYIFLAGTATVRPNAGSDDVLGYGSFKADNNTQLGLTFSYLVTDNIGVELLAATPFRHKIGLGPTGNIAEVKQLPPTLMAQYYFRDKQDKLRPYLGIGLNYTTFFDEKFNNTGASAGLTDLSVKDSWGFRRPMHVPGAWGLPNGYAPTPNTAPSRTSSTAYRITSSTTS